jgi:outer membrane biosynthesis protein TonB
MSDSFVLPDGITLSMTDQGLVIENEGDIVLHGQIEGGIHSLTSRDGNVVLNNDFTLHRIDAPNGAVEIHGRIEADRIEAASVQADGEAFVVRVVQASQSISVGETTTHAEVLIAPAVNLSTQAVGRITVVESHNELSATKVKGCLTLNDLEELFDGSEGFIRGWEITPLHKSGRKASSKPPARKAAKKAVAKPKPKPAPEPEPEPEPAPEPVPTPEPEPAPEPVAETVEAPPAVVEAEVEEEVVEEPPPISMPAPAAATGERAEQVEQLFDLFDETEEESGADPELHARITGAVNELVSYYADVDLPPVVQRLAQLVAEKDYKTIRDEVDDIWNQLLRYHKQQKLRPKPSLTTTFNTIHAIVREM